MKPSPDTITLEAATIDELAGELRRRSTGLVIALIDAALSNDKSDYTRLYYGKSAVAALGLATDAVARIQANMAELTEPQEKS